MLQFSLVFILQSLSITVQLFLEISGKWPDDLVAIEAIKVEFMCKIADLLRENGTTTYIFPTYLLVIWVSKISH